MQEQQDLQKDLEVKIRDLLASKQQCDSLQETLAKERQEAAKLAKELRGERDAAQE